MAVALVPKEIEALFALMPVADAFASLEASLCACPEAVESDHRSVALDSVESIAKNLPFAIDWVSVVFMAAPDYLRKEQGSGSQVRSFEDRLRDLLGIVLRQAAPAERSALIGALLPDLADLSLLCAVLCKGSGDETPEELFGAGLAELKTRLCARVERLAAKGDIWQQAAPSAILWFWWAAQEDRVYAFVKSSMMERRGLTALLDMIIEPAARTADGAAAIAVRRWSKIIDFQTLEKQALQLALSGAERDDRRRARRFLDAFGNGKSELFR